MKTLSKPLLICAFFSSVLLISNQAFAFAYGEPVVRAQIGQSLVFVTSLYSEEYPIEKDCFQAKVFYANKPVSNRLVSLTIEGKQPLFALIVKADSALQEPIATVDISSECGFNYSRTYSIQTTTKESPIPDATSVGVNLDEESHASPADSTAEPASQPNPS